MGEFTFFINESSRCHVMHHEGQFVCLDLIINLYKSYLIINLIINIKIYAVWFKEVARE